MRAAGVLLAALVVLSVGAAHAAPGELDPGFGKNGRVTTTFGSGWDSGNDVVLQPDGKLVVAGGGGGTVAHQHFALARYLRDGTLDRTFGKGGRVRTTLAARFDEALRIALQPDGKIVAVGAGSDGSGSEQAIVTRYRPDGSLDSSFGHGGFVMPLASSSVLTGLAIQPDGRIVVVGSLDESADPYAYDLLVARLEADGALDKTFGTGGSTTVSFGDDSSAGSGVALQPDGKIVSVGSRFVHLAGTDATERRGVVVARFRPDGSLDPSFGSAGLVTTRITDAGEGTSIALQSDGKILVGGSDQGLSGEDFTPRALVELLRYLPDGTLDPSFGAGGRVERDVGGFGYAADLAVVAGGRIAVAVARFDAFEAARYLPDGTPDRSFGARGVAVTSFDGKNDFASSLAAQPDGKLVLAGTTYDAERQNWDFGLVRYLGTQAVCRVPRVKGQTLARAAAAIRTGHCRLGAVRGTFSRVPRGRVVTQSPKAGTRLVAGGRVALVVSKGKRP